MTSDKTCTAENPRGQSVDSTDDTDKHEKKAQASARDSLLGDVVGDSSTDRSALAIMQSLRAGTALGDPKQLLETLSQAQTRTEANLDKVVNAQGYVLGTPFNWLKNNLGTSSEGRSWYHPAALWSNVLDYNNGSEAVTQRVKDTRTSLHAAEFLMERGENDAANKLLNSLVTKDANGNPMLRSEQEPTRFDRSQQNGVNLLSDMAVMAAAHPVANPWARLLVGGTVKTGLKLADGAYSQPVSDFVTGALVSYAPMAGKYVGAGVSRTVSVSGERLAAVLAGSAPAVESYLGTAAGSAMQWLGTAARTTTGFASPMLGYGANAAVLSGNLTGTETYTQMRHEGHTMLDSLARAGHEGGKSALFGFGVGMVGGAVGEAWRRSKVLTVNPGEGPMSQPVLGQNPQEVRRQLLEVWDKAKAAGPEKFQETLKTEVNGMLDRFGLPPIRELEWKKSGTLLGQKYGATRQDRLQFFDTPSYDAVNFLAHELTHAEQYALRTRLFADRAGIGRQWKPTQLYDVGKSITSSQDADRVILNWRSTLPNIHLTPQETERAIRIARGFDDYWGVHNWKTYMANNLEREAYPVGRQADFYNRVGIHPIGLGVGLYERRQ